MSKHRYVVEVQACDGAHKHKFATLASARAEMEAQLGTTIESFHAYRYDDGEGGYKPINVDALFADPERAERGIRMSDDDGRSISLRAL